MDISKVEQAYAKSVKNGGKQYFDPQIIRRDENEVFVDCGGYKGETVQDFAAFTNGCYSHIYFFEPDPRLMDEAQKELSGFPSITYLPYGVGEKRQELHFHATGDMTGCFCESGTENVPVVSIDEEIQEKVTFIKMDIEGMEMKALKGARRTILRYKPKLAICVYHRCDHIFRVFHYVLGLRPDYRIYVRHYTEGLAETVMYFI